jgi:hypothetical protein
MKTKKIIEKTKNQVVQVTLKYENTSMQTHINHRFKGKTVKEGMHVELKDDVRIWTIDKIYGDPVDKNTINHGWNNNI